MKKGYLDVGDGHRVYWEDWGNPKAFPTMYLHGGPGSGFGKSAKALFDPKKHRVIFFDQRGAGRSKPFASTHQNTTHHLIADAERLREHLGITRFNLVGGSWGSALSLLYAIAHPHRVRRMVLWGVYLVRQFETDFVNEGFPRYFFPEAWEEFISRVPQRYRKNGDSIMRYYAHNIRSKNQKRAKEFADAWTVWESTLVSISYNPQTILKEVKSDRKTKAVALLETHYFLNKCFIPENYILKNVKKIRDIPCYAVQGYFDMCTPSIAAHDLKLAYGKQFRLTRVRSGHMSSDQEMHAALRKLIETKLR